MVATQQDLKQRLAALSPEQRARLLAEVRDGRRDRAAANRVRRVPRTGPLPLSFAQERLWFLDRWSPGTAVYNSPLALRLRGELDVSALRRALTTVVARHEILRTRYLSTPDGPRQLARPAPELVPLPVTDLTGHPGDLTGALVDFAVAEGTRPIDLATDPMLRASLARAAEDDHLLVLATHHISIDGESVPVLLGELAQAYLAHQAGQEPVLPDLPVQYADYAAWQREQPTAEGLAYWTERLAGLPTLAMPTDRPRPAEPTFAGGNLGHLLPATLHRDLLALAERTGTRVLPVLTAGLAALLTAYTGQHDIVVGSVFGGRSRTELEGLIGFFTNSVVLRVSTHGDPTFLDLVARAHETVLGAHNHQDVPFDEVVRALRPDRDGGRNPLFQVALFQTGAGDEEGRFGSLSMSPVDQPGRTARFDAGLGFGERANAGGIELDLEYSTELFDPDRMTRLLGHLERLLTAAVADPEARLSELDLLTPAEHRQLVRGWNSTSAPVRDTAPTHEVIATRAAEAPQTVAVVHAGTELTYAELDRRANRLAHRLRALGAGPGELVGVSLRRGLPLVVGLLAVLKSGAAYVPMDPAYPVARLAGMVEDAGPVVLLTDESSQAALSGLGVPTVSPESEVDGPGHGPGVPVHHEDLAYVIYTSGSTGRPKGVAVTHRNLTGFRTVMDRVLGGEPQVWLALSSVSFDVSVTELLWTLSRGSRVVLGEADTAHLFTPGDPRALASLLTSQDITHVQCTPSLAELVAGDGPALAALAGRHVLLAGENLPPALAGALHEAGVASLVNGYGPTECTVYATSHRVTRADAATPVVPIGRPVAHGTAHVLDPHLRPLPVGVPGELHLGGDGVTRGYLGRPGLTADRFRPDPFGPPGSRAYRTGDLVRRRADGTLEFLGRLDHQVKVRGFRVELGEVETALRALPGVAASVVVARRDSGETRLIGYLAGASRTPEPEIKAALRARLPEYLVPARVLWLERLPLNPNGKVDRAALPAPDAAATGTGYVAPATPAERALADVWAEVLDLDRVSADDGFFALGGSSLSVIRAVEVAARSGLAVTPQQFFRHRTLAELARVAVLGAAPLTADTTAPVVTLKESGTGAPLFLVHSVGGTALPYLALGEHLPEDVPAHGLQAPGLAGGPVLADMAALVDRHLTTMREIAPAGPYHLAGWSSGGWLAVAIAAELKDRGADVGVVALLDSMPPGALPPGMDEADALAEFVSGYGLSTGLPPVTLDRAALRALPETERYEHAVAALTTSGQVRARERRGVLARARVAVAATMAGVRWRPGTYEGRLDLLIADSGLTEPAVSGWRPHVRGPLTVRRVPGDHYAMVRAPHAATLGATLGELLADHAARASRT